MRACNLNTMGDPMLKPWQAVDGFVMRQCGQLVCTCKAGSNMHPVGTEDWKLLFNSSVRNPRKVVGMDVHHSVV